MCLAAWGSAATVAAPSPAVSLAPAVSKQAPGCELTAGPAGRTGRVGRMGWKRARCDARYLGRTLMLKDPADRRRATAVALAAAAAYAVREPVRDEIRRHRNVSRRRVYERARNLGKGLAGPLAALSFWAAGKSSGRDEYRETAQIILESNVFAALGTAAGSFTLAAERPEEGSSIDVFDVNGHGVSLDVTLAASLVPAIDRRHLRAKPGDGRGRRFWKGVGRGALYSAIGLTAMQRMDDDKHWLPDVFLGASIGLATGHALCSAHEAPAASARLTPAPPRRSRFVVNGRGAGMAWTF